MQKIKIKIDGREAEVESAPEVVTDNAEYEVEFAVDERDGWNPAVPMTALFVRRDAKYTAVVMDAGETTCTMPPLTKTNVVYIGLTQEEMRTTTPARIAIRRSVRTMTDFPPLPDKDVYAQILANFAGLRMLSGKGAPSTETVGKVNQLYRDKDNNRIYVCVDDTGGYTWAMIGGGGGGGTVVTIDTTLSKSGQAADAKAVGDALANKADTAEMNTALASKANIAAVDAALAEVDAALANKANKTEIPNVPSWAMASRKPTYTASEVGALPNTTAIPDVSGKLDKSQGTANAGKFLVVGADGNIATKTMSEWAGGSY